MKVKEILRTANVAWSPAEHHPIYLAAGTAAQQLDATFSTSASLDIYSLNLGETSLEMPLKASLPSKDRFHKLVWGAHGISSHDKPSGVLVGGMDMGHIQMFDPAKIILNEPALVAESSKHSGPVRSLDFNPFQLNLLASGATESEIFIWDLNNPSAAMSPGAASQPPDDVTSVAWNRQVQHILGSTFSSRCVVWDLRKNEPIIKVSDSTSRMKIKVMAWHPDIATQLCIASEDDLAPVIELWDLRFATSPLKTMESHQKGILSIAWCPQDPDLLLSCGKDNRILVWNPNSDVKGGEVLCELATSNQWSFDVSWCPRNPSIISTSSFDGHVALYSVMGGSEEHLPSMAAPTSNLADSFPGMESFGNVPPLLQHPTPTHHSKPTMSQLKRPPKWMRTRCGASFGFGGKLVSFGVDASMPGREVFVSQVVTEPELLERSQGLEHVLNAAPEHLREFCASKACLATDTKQRQIWELLQSQYAENPRQKQLEMLGFQAETIAQKIKQLANKTDKDGSTISDSEDKKPSLPFGRPDGFVNGADEFDTISQPTDLVKKLEPFRISVDNSEDGLLSQALLTGQIAEAVEVCLNADRMAEALLLAMCGGAELYQSTQKRFIQSRENNDTFALIRAVVTASWHDFVQYGSLDNWREMLAAVLSYARVEELPVLCESLGHRLATEKGGVLKAEAVLCYICAGNLEKMVEAWVSAGHPLATSNELQELVEQAMVLRKALQLTGRVSQLPSGPLTSQLCRYASLLAGQGSLPTALSYLDLSNDASMVELKNRLQIALGHQSQPQARTMHAQAFSRPQQQIRSSSYAQTYPGAPVQEPQPGRFIHPSAPAPQSMARPSVFNPLTVQPTATAFTPQPLTPSAVQSVSQVPLLSPGAASSLVAPPPATASTGTTPSKGGLLSQRTRAYVQHPSMFTTPAPAQPAQNLYSPAPVVPTPSFAQSTFSPMPSASSPYGAPVGGMQGLSMNGTLQPTLMPNTYSYTSSDAPTSFGSTTMEPALQPMPTPPAPRPMTPSSITGATLPPPPVSNPPPGWNDPPMFTAVAKSKTQKVEPVMEPITHPLFGVAQPEPQQPSVPYQTGNFYNPVAAAAAVPATDVFGHSGMVEQAREAEPVAFQAPPPPVQEIRNIPEEHQILHDVFLTLKEKCFALANSPQMRRKLDDVAKKLDNLTDRLRTNTLSNPTLQGLHQIVQAVQDGDYATGLALQTQLVSGLNFSEIGAFMPGVKVLLQLAAQLGVYLQ